MGVQKRFKPQEYHSKEEIARVRAKYNLPERFILYVGRINARKNIENIIRSLSYLKSGDIKFVLGGNYDWKTLNLPELTKELRIEDRVLALGFIDDLDLPILYSIAYLFCYVSHDEGFGLPPIESLASGVPVVVANAGSLPEICRDAGVYCNPHDPKDIAEKLDSLLSDSSLYEYKKKKGIEIAKKYNWADSAKHLMEIFKKVGGVSN
jgi:glycosyltransferase involved in cell wall biosynthesis